MEFITLTVANIIWIIYAMSEGVREAHFMHFKGFRKCAFNIEIVFLSQRAIVLSLISLAMYSLMGPIALLLSIGQVFMFEYFHKVLFNVTKKRLNNYNMEINQDVNLKRSLLFIGLALQIFIYMFII